MTAHARDLILTNLAIKDLTCTGGHFRHLTVRGHVK